MPKEKITLDELKSQVTERIRHNPASLDWFANLIDRTDRFFRHFPPDEQLSDEQNAEFYQLKQQYQQFGYNLHVINRSDGAIIPKFSELEAVKQNTTEQTSARRELVQSGIGASQQSLSKYAPILIGIALLFLAVIGSAVFIYVQNEQQQERQERERREARRQAEREAQEKLEQQQAKEREQREAQARAEAEAKARAEAEAKAKAEAEAKAQEEAQNKAGADSGDISGLVERGNMPVLPSPKVSPSDERALHASENLLKMALEQGWEQRAAGARLNGQLYKVYEQYDVYENGEMGMRVYADFEVIDQKHPGKMIVAFLDKEGKPMKPVSKEYTKLDKGFFYGEKTFPIYTHPGLVDKVRVKDFFVFVPYKALRDNMGFYLVTIGEDGDEDGKILKPAARSFIFNR